jgi:putative NADH-flavin reductase
MVSQKPLRVAVISPKGQCGSCVVDELLSRGHHVTGISRSPPENWEGDTSGSYKAVAADLYNVRGFAKVLSGGYDSIVCAYGPPIDNLSKIYTICVEAHCRIKEALLTSDHKGSFIIVGGAGPLHNKKGVCFADEEEFAYAQWLVLARELFGCGKTNKDLRYAWPSQHLNYMYVHAKDHGSLGFARFIWLFWWARNNVEAPGCK